MFDHPAIAALAALFVWWFSTGAILWAVQRADRKGPGAHGRLVLVTLPLLIGGVAGAVLAAGAYAGFLSALAIWGWIELTFLTGTVTGYARGPMPYCATVTQRFRAAWAALAWHELALAAGFVFLLTSGQEVALWTYAVLWFARLSAKLNIFLGVPRINTEFLPAPLAHLPSYFRQGPVSWLFPISILVLTGAVFGWVERIAMTGDVKFALLGALTALALLEHWLMVLPLPDEKLWRWAMPAPLDKTREERGEHGF